MPNTQTTIETDELPGGEAVTLWDDASTWNDGNLWRDGFTGVTPESFNLDDYAGFTFRDKPILDLDGVINQIDSGNSQQVNGGTITYTFLDGNNLTGLYNNPQYGFTAGEGLTPFTDAQRDAARDSIQLWDDLIDATFVEMNGRGADIQFASSADPGQAYAYYPEYDFTNAQGWKFFGDVFVADPEINWTNNWLGFNGYGATTLIHEIGHAVGLSHPGAYNGAGATTYVDQAEYAQDSEQYSIMSYWSPSETGASVIDWSTFLFGNAQTPMLHDILTIQAKYGADENTRADDTTYGFNSTAGRDVFDFSLNEYPNLSIYDAGGIDTLDMSGFGASVFIDLHDGAFSSAAQAVPDADVINANRADLSDIAGFPLGDIGQATVDAVAAGRMNLASNQIASETGVSGIEATALFNISIAYGTVIENAVGGSERDLLWGNEVDNMLDGGAGDDVLRGFEGDDLLFGGSGADTFTFVDGDGDDVIADFEDGVDLIELYTAGPVSVVQDGDDTVITYADGSITLLDTDYTTITADDFA
ncbi:M10 family metallopeptidase C-terminal domain-containing protein [Kordiimonas lacus]|uniref:Serralysin n=1 Tax=Kordiimonas lacus TaxID=637679 RepID=A0A1G7CMT0_9PROT|nr:M10 family metallopeptidase C-terminal domain-containing protein [Kordiimonas lacus]SDE39966.1 serralysin [Kordiimonas lacus]